MKRYKLLFLIVLAVILIAACDDEIMDQPPKIPSVWVTNTDIDSVKFRWNCEDPDGDDLIYDFFFGSTNPPDIKLTKSSEKEYVVEGRLQANKVYYYKVIAYDEDDYSSESAVKNFTTGSAWAKLPPPPENPYPGQSWTVMVGYTRVPMKFVYIPQGSFMMGALDNDTNATDAEKPRHQVTIQNGFWMAKYELSLKDWGAITGQGFQEYEYATQVKRSLSLHGLFGIDYMLDNLNEYSFGNPWRLPTEAEWEHACRAGTETIYFWGDDPEGYEDYVCCNADTIVDPYPDPVVGTKSPNPWGLHDILGNVSEWTADEAPEERWEGEGYINAPTDGSAWKNYPDSEHNVARGGYLGFSIEQCRSSARYRVEDSNFSGPWTGVRFVIDPTRYNY